MDAQVGVCEHNYGFRKLRSGERPVKLVHATFGAATDTLNMSTFIITYRVSAAMAREFGFCTEDRKKQSMPKFTCHNIGVSLSCENAEFSGIKNK